MPVWFMITQVLSSFLIRNLREGVSSTKLEGRQRRTIKILSNRNLKFLCGNKKRLSLPMHIRGPSPNGRYV